MSATAIEPIPATWYSDAAQAEREQRAIFRTTWQIGALASELAENGSYVTVEVGGFPVVITRDNQGKLNALLNVCPHRAMILASGAGKAKLLQCPNHAWTFGLDGAFRNAPRADREPGFCADGLDLHRRVAQAAPRWLAPGGHVLIETSERQAPRTAQLLAAAGLVTRVVTDDELDGTVVVATWPEGIAPA